jgi:hypothetical protein
VSRSDSAQRQRKVILGRDGREADQRVEAQCAVVRDVKVKADAARAVRAQLVAGLPQRSSTDPATLQRRLDHEPKDPGLLFVVAFQEQRSDDGAAQLGSVQAMPRGSGKNAR